LLQIESNESPVPIYQQVNRLENQIGALTDVEIITGANNSLTVGELFDRMKIMPPDERFDLTATGSITQGVAKLVRDEYLANEAYARGLETRPGVEIEVTDRRNEIAAALMRQIVLDSVRVSPSSTLEYYRANSFRYQEPAKIRIREILVRTRSLADSLYTLVDDGANKLEELARIYSVRQWAKEKGGDLGYFQAGAFGTLGTRAFQSPVGKLEGPIEIKLGGRISGYSVYRVLDRTDPTIPIYSEVENQVYDDAFDARRSQVMDLFLQNVKKRHPVQVNYGLLVEIHTTDDIGSGLPMDMIAIRRR